MNPSRNGKIARLPRPVRDELNQRLDNGETGRQLIAWLNALPAVQAVLLVHFEGSPINEQNLSAWKLGGFADWQRHQAAQEWVGRLAEESADLEAGSGSVRLADRIALAALMELGQALHHARTLEDPAEHRKAVQSVALQVARLRQGDHQATRLGLQRERWEMDREDRLREREKEDRKAAAGAQIKADFFPGLDENCSPKTGLSGPQSGVAALFAASARLREEAGLPPARRPGAKPAPKRRLSRTRRRPTLEIKVNQGESRSLKVAPGNQIREPAKRRPRAEASSIKTHRSPTEKATPAEPTHQGSSSQIKVTQGNGPTHSTNQNDRRTSGSSKRARKLIRQRNQPRPSRPYVSIDVHVHGRERTCAPRAPLRLPGERAHHAGGFAVPVAP